MTNPCKINQVPSITWNWLKSNYDTVELNSSFKESLPEITQIPDCITVNTSDSISLDLSNLKSGTFNISTPKALDTRASDGTIIENSKKELPSHKDHPFSKIIQDTIRTPQIITIAGESDKPLILKFDFTSDSVAKQVINVKENSNATVIMIFKGNASATLLQTQIIAEAYSKLHIIKIQLMGKESLLLDDTGIECKESADVKFTQLELGGLHIDSGLHTSLTGYKSRFTSNVAYISQNQQYFDFNHIVYHLGKKTECDMQINGTLKDQATKIYRGTIDFKKGCCGAKGNEMEESLVLSPKTTNKSLPTILCDEEDVEGEHGATIGRLSQDILFYMETRGINEKEAEQIMSRAKLQAVSDTIPDEAIQEEITQWLDNNI